MRLLVGRLVKLEMLLGGRRLLLDGRGWRLLGHRRMQLLDGRKLLLLFNSRGRLLLEGWGWMRQLLLDVIGLRLLDGKGGQLLEGRRRRRRLLLEGGRP